MQYYFVEYYAATCIPERYFGHTHCFPTKTISPAEWETHAHSATYGTVSKERAAEGGRGGGGQREKTFLAAKPISSLSFFFSGKQRGPLSLSLSPFLSGSWPARRVPHHHSAYAAVAASAAASEADRSGGFLRKRGSGHSRTRGSLHAIDSFSK